MIIANSLSVGFFQGHPDATEVMLEEVAKRL